MTTISYRSFIHDFEREEALDLGYTQFEPPKHTTEFVVNKDSIVYKTSHTWLNDYHAYRDLKLSEQDASNLDVYHKLIKRMLASGRWTPFQGKTEPDYTAEGGRYTLGLLRHFYKDGNVYEMSVHLPINYPHTEVSTIIVYSRHGDGTMGEFLPLVDAIEDMDAFINNIERLFVSAATAKSFVHEVKVSSMATDYDLLKESFLIKKGEIKKRPCITLGDNTNSDFGSDFGFVEYAEEDKRFNEHKDLRVIGFDTSLVMQVAFTDGDKNYIYDVPFNEYQKALAAKWTPHKAKA